jgi:hypothetical protein
VVEVSEVMLSGSAASSLYRQVCARRRLRKALARGRPVILLQAGGLSGEGSARPSGKDRHAGSTAPCRRVSSRVDWSQALVVDLPYGELSSAPHRPGLEVDRSEWTYAQAEETADFGSRQASLSVRIRQAKATLAV